VNGINSVLRNIVTQHSRRMLQRPLVQQSNRKRSDYVPGSAAW